MNLNRYNLKNGLVYLNGELVKKDILIENGIVIKIEDNIIDMTNIDCSSKLITPSFIDGHVHFRTPGLSYKEDLKSGSLAALHGGYSHVCTMANTIPCLDNYNDMSEYLEQINKEAHCNIIPFSAATLDLKGEKKVDFEKLSTLDIVGFSDDGRGVQDDELMKEILIECGKHNKLFSAHCEDEEELGNANSFNKSSNNENGINNASEANMIRRDVEIIKKIHNKYEYQYHVCHISTRESLEVIKDAKHNKLNVTCEVTPHHLISNDSEIDLNDTNYKMNPPLRSKEDQEAMIEALNSGLIDMIATDHAPHSNEDKQLPIDQAPFGIIGLELAFSLIYTNLVKTNKVKLETILKAMIDKPQEVFKIDNSLKVGNRAYLNIIDLDEEISYTKDNLYSKSSNTFYLNTKLFGVIEETIFENERYQWRKGD
ncbi:MAG: dihydroorotase [Erysipelotrichales bacterium]